ncbi:MAG: MFS transporter [Desulfosalsimonadaceae bacterium]
MPETSENRRLEASTLLVATVTSFIGPYLISAVNVALPAIQTEFAVSAVMLSWVATSYLLSTALFLVPMGKIANIYGRKRIFTIGLLLLTASAFFLSLAGSVPMLIFLRAVQGFSAAMIVSTGMAILTSVFPPDRRGRAIGIYVAAVYVGLSVGPTAGGVLTHHFGWRSVFWSVLPLGVVSVAITMIFLKKEWKGQPGETFDLTGSVIYAASLLLLMYGASLAPELKGFIAAGCGILGFFLFFKHEQSIPWPVFEVGLFQNNRVFAFSSLAALINYAATFAVTFMMSLYLQLVKGFNPQTAGFILVAQPVVQALLSPVAGRWSDRVEPRFLASIGMGLTAMGLIQLIFISPKTPVGYVLGILVMLGVGFALFSSPNMNALMGSVEKKHFGIASGAVATMRLLGQMASMAIVTVIFSLCLGGKPVCASNQTLFLVSAKVIFLIFTGLCLAGIYFSLARGNLRGMRNDESIRVTHPDPRQQTVCKPGMFVRRETESSRSPGNGIVHIRTWPRLHSLFHPPVRPLSPARWESFVS